MSKFRQREIEVVPGQKCTFSPDPNVPIGSCYAVLAITNREGQENAYTIAVSCAANPYFRREWIKEIKSWIPAGSEQPSRPDDVNELDHTVTVYVAARTRRDVLVSIEVPESSTARAGRYPLVFDIREHSPERDALLGNREEIRIDAFVAPYRAWDCTLTPEEATTNITRRRSAGLLTVTNRGNDWLYCQISAKVNDPRLRIDLPTSVIAVPPPDADGGASERRIPVALRTTARSLRGPVIVQSLQLTVQPLDAPSIPALPPDWRGQPDAERPLNVTTAPATGTGAQTPQVNLTYRAIFQAVLEFFRRFFQRTFSTVRNGITTVIGALLALQILLFSWNAARQMILAVEFTGKTFTDGTVKIKSKQSFLIAPRYWFVSVPGDDQQSVREFEAPEAKSLPASDIGERAAKGIADTRRKFRYAALDGTKLRPGTYKVKYKILGRFALLSYLIPFYGWVKGYIEVGTKGDEDIGTATIAGRPKPGEEFSIKLEPRADTDLPPDKPVVSLDPKVGELPPTNIQYAPANRIMTVAVPKDIQPGEYNVSVAWEGKYVDLEGNLTVAAPPPKTPDPPQKPDPPPPPPVANAVNGGSSGEKPPVFIPPDRPNKPAPQQKPLGIIMVLKEDKIADAKLKLQQQPDDVTAMVVCAYGMIQNARNLYTTDRDKANGFLEEAARLIGKAAPITANDRKAQPTLYALALNCTAFLDDTKAFLDGKRWDDDANTRISDAYWLAIDAQPKLVLPYLDLLAFHVDRQHDSECDDIFEEALRHIKVDTFRDPLLQERMSNLYERAMPNTKHYLERMRLVPTGAVSGG